ncbi:unnamed protein product [Auanema sp. JU1783]|nr:unnamed protein product [Auanema sp. JU1783]
MVFSKGHNTPWSIHEQRMLLEQFLVSPDWPSRCSEMCKEFCDSRSRGFFTPKSCQTEFDRILQTPCPGHRASASSTTTFSRKALVDSWITYMDSKIEKEDEKTFELELVELRKKSSIIERLIGNSGSSYSNSEVEDLLHEARVNDAKVSDQHQLCHVVNSYMHRLKEVMNNCNLKEEEGNTEDSDGSARPVSLNDLTALDETSTSPARSPLKSPIRAIADVYREHMSPSMDQPSFASSNTFNNDPMTNSNIVKDVSSSQDSLLKEKTTSSDKSLRRKGKKEPKEETDVVASEESHSKTAKEGNKRKPSRTEALDDILVENSPAGRSSRRGVVDSPLISSRSKKGKNNDSDSVDLEDRKMNEYSHDRVPSETPSTQSVPTSEIPEVPAFTEVGTMTEISIQGSLWNHQEKKDSRRSAASRKSTRRSEVTIEEKASGSNGEVGVQTKKIEFEKDDKVIVSWNTSERFFVRTVGIEGKKLKEEDWSDDDDDALATLAKKAASASVEDDEDEKKGKQDSKKDIFVLYDTDEWLARLLLLKANHKLDDGKLSFSPSKRPRKEEKGKDDNVSTKAYLLNIWRIVCNHKHSGIFSHPVNEKEAPGYSDAIKQKMDLSTLKKEIESGQVSNLLQLKMKLALMFANAIMFNSTGHDVNTYAQEMAKETMDELCRLGNLNRKLPLGPSRRSRVHEEIVTKFAPKSRTLAITEAPTGKVRQIFSRKPTIYETRRVLP